MGVQMGKKKYTDKEKDKMVDAVDALRKNKNLTMNEACKEASVQPSLYQWWKGKREGKYNYNRKPTTTNEDLGRSIGVALNELNTGGAAQARPVSRTGGKRSLIAKLYRVKSALMELEQELVLDGMGEHELEAD
jgi:transposase-like protein